MKINTDKIIGILFGGKVMQIEDTLHFKKKELRLAFKKLCKSLKILFK